MTSYYIAAAHFDKLIRFIITFLLVSLLLTISFPYLIYQGVLIFSELMAIVYFMFLFTVLPFLFIFGLRKIYVHEQVGISNAQIASTHIGNLSLGDVQKIKSYKFFGWRFTKVKMKLGHSYIFGPYQALQKEAIATYDAFRQRLCEQLA